MSRNKILYPAVAMLMLVTLLLAACGETATPPATTSAATTAATTSAAATTAAMTSAAMTSAAATAATTTVAMTTAATAMTSAAMTTSSTAMTTGTAAATSATGSTVPAVQGATEITLDPLVQTGLKTGFQGQASGVNDLDFKVYGSDNDVNTLINNADTAFTAAGYSFAIPGGSKSIKQGSASVAFYSKPSTPDAFLIYGDPSAGLGVSGLDASNLQLIAPELKTRKSVLILVTGTGLINSLVKAGAAGTGVSGGTTTTAAGTDTSTAAATTSAATTTSAAATTAASGSGAANLPTVPGATEVNLSPTIQNALKTGFGGQASAVQDLTFQIFGSDSDATTLTSNADTAFTSAGYKFAIPGATKPVTQSGASIGFYAKDGAPDLYLIVEDGTNPSAGTAGLDPKTLGSIAPELQSKKSIMILIGGTGLIKGLQGAGAAGGAATPAATPTA